jgi:hypothetical protein
MASDLAHLIAPLNAHTANFVVPANKKEAAARHGVRGYH